MHIVLHPRAAPNDRLRVWIGAFQATRAPALQWLLDGAAVAPVPLRTISSVRPDSLLPTDRAPENQPRTFTGVYDFPGLAPDTPHTVTVEADGISARLETRTLPAQVPTLLNGTFNVLLVSCFHQHEDPRGLAGIIVSQLKATAKPHLTLLMGDQVYLDLPTLQDFQDDAVWLARKFEHDYATNWQGVPGYAQVLAAAPSISTPDDHEFWNNYPHPSPFIGNSLHPDGQARWRQAALALYEGFQLPYPSSIGAPTIIEVPPLSFFVADMRSQRDPGRRFTMVTEAHNALQAWVSDVIKRNLFAVFVAGQSLFSKPADDLGGAIGDFQLPNYADYKTIMQQLQRLAEAARPTLCLTGDVHWGRIVAARDMRTQRIAFYEIIASPSSLVTTVGADQIKAVGGFLGGLFGKPTPWPRHADPAEPPNFLASEVFAGQFHCSTLHRQKGNHVALLSFSQTGTSIQFRVTYWPISRDSTIGRPQEVGPLQLISI
jgi:hypothetical protein